MTILHTLEKEKLIHPPKWMSDNTQYLCIMGSVAYGVSNDTSDTDLYGYTIPPKQMVFPHLNGEIEGFGHKKERFEQFSKHGIEYDDKNYDVTVFNIVKYFSLCMDGNPNMIDSMFVPLNCIVHSTAISNLVRERRHLFLSKVVFPRMKGYAYAQLSKMSSKNRTGKRKEMVETWGFDLKFSYQVVRLLSQCEQILAEGTLDIQETGRREHMKAIRRGDVSEEDIRKWAADKELQLEKLYNESKLPYGPDEPKIKQLLLDCLEHHYGSLDKCIVQPNKELEDLRAIYNIVSRYI